MIKVIVEFGHFRLEFDKLDEKVPEFFNELLRWKDVSTPTVSNAKKAVKGRG